MRWNNLAALNQINRVQVLFSALAWYWVICLVVLMGSTWSIYFWGEGSFAILGVLIHQCSQQANSTAWQFFGNLHGLSVDQSNSWNLTHLSPEWPKFHAATFKDIFLKGKYQWELDGLLYKLKTAWTVDFHAGSCLSFCMIFGDLQVLNVLFLFKMLFTSYNPYFVKWNFIVQTYCIKEPS